MGKELGWFESILEKIRENEYDEMDSTVDIIRLIRIVCWV